MARPNPLTTPTLLGPGSLVRDNPLVAPYMPYEVVYASPKYKGQSSQSIRSRRSNGSSSDESPVPTPEGLIEEDLRAGGPGLREPPCVTYVDVPHWHPHYEKVKRGASFSIIAQVRDICRQENLRHDEIRFCGRRSVFEPPNSTILTLLIYATRERLTDRGWAGIARKILNFLRAKGLNGVPVEIIDPRFTEGPSLHPCYPTDEIFPKWRQVVEDILAQVDRTGIYTIGCFRIGSHPDRFHCPPTVLLGVERQANRNWKDARERVIEVLEEHGLGSVAVLIRKDTNMARTADLTPTAADASDCRPDPNLGVSLGPHAIQEAIGTLGGWVELRHPPTGKWIPFALTCSHCCFPRADGLPDADKQVLRNWKQQGVRPNDANASRLLLIDTPCYRDIQNGIDEAEKSIKEDEANSIFSTVEKAKKDGWVDPRDERRLKNFTDHIDKCTEDKTTMEKFLDSKGHNLGTVFAASGLREVTSTKDPTKLSHRDWALVRLNATRSAGKNALKYHKGLAIKGLEGFRTTGPQMDEILWKMGRVTGITKGTYANLDICNVGGGASATWEHAVILPRDIFARAGDSGSLLFNGSGDVRGIIFSGSRNCDVAYFTSTRDLLEDIRHIVGLRDIDEIRLKTDDYENP